MIEIVEVQPLAVGAIGQDHRIAARLDRPVDVAAQDGAVVHLDRHVPVDPHAVADFADFPIAHVVSSAALLAGCCRNRPRSRGRCPEARRAACGTRLAAAKTLRQESAEHRPEFIEDSYERSDHALSPAARICRRRDVRAPLSRAEAQAQTAVTFSLDFRALGRHAAWYVALEKGYYKKAGLDVTIIPSQGTAQAIQSVEIQGRAVRLLGRRRAGRGARQQRRHRQDGRGDLPEGAIRDLLAALRRQRHQARAAGEPGDRERRRLASPRR